MNVRVQPADIMSCDELAPSRDDFPGSVVSVPVSHLRPGETPRLAGHSDEHVERLAEVDGPLPPILVDRRTMRIVDGRHRLMAAILNGRGSIDVVFCEGSPDDLFLRAVATNVRHGYPLTAADRRAAAARIIGSHPELSDRAIAHVAGLGTKAVAAIRRQLDDALPLTSIRLGRDGRRRPLDGTQGRLKVAELLSHDPQVSAREAARIAGVSPATASDVRKRLARGEAPVSARVERRRAAPPSVPADPAVIVQRLMRDPSLRDKQEGRRLLQLLLRGGAIAPEDLSELIDAVPTHCTPAVLRLAQYYASLWSNFARELGSIVVDKDYL